ncbi:MAG: hypothetical protein AAFP20_00790 [Cyanobacteria bacterium J06614_10]
MAQRLFSSNLLRLIRQLHIFVVEGRGYVKEAGYWQGITDDIRSIKGLEENPLNLVAWISGCLEDFKAVEGPKLLIFDAVAYLYKVCNRRRKKSLRTIFLVQDRAVFNG